MLAAFWEEKQPLCCLGLLRVIMGQNWVRISPLLGKLQPSSGILRPFYMVHSIKKKSHNMNSERKEFWEEMRRDMLVLVCHCMEPYRFTVKWTKLARTGAELAYSVLVLACHGMITWDVQLLNLICREFCLMWVSFQYEECSVFQLQGLAWW